MLKQTYLIMLTQSYFLLTLHAKIHIIEPLCRKNITRSKPITSTNIYDKNCQSIQINVTNTNNVIDMLRALKPLAEKKITIKAPEHIAPLISWCAYVDDVITTGHCACDAEVAIEDVVRINKKMNFADKQIDPYFSVDEQIAALWHEVFVQDPNYKIGICCQSLQATRTPHMQIESFYPLACMQDVSVYSFDEVKPAHVPDHINVYTFSKQIKKSLTHIAAALGQLDLIITTQPFVTQLCEALGKKVWYISSEQEYKHYAHITHFNPSDNNHVVFDMMHHLAITMEKPSAKIVSAEIATGELIDKMTILEIKTERIDDEKKLANIWRELHTLRRTFNTFITPTPKLEQLIQELKAANEALWTTEDLIRDKERENSFDNEFILLARSVYIQNDERCRVKREINELLGSRLVEEKSYKPYN